MIVTIVISFYIFILIYLYGVATVRGLSHILGVSNIDGDIDFPQFLLVGVVTVTVIAMIANLFIPLGAVFFISLLIGALVIAFQKRFFISQSLPKYHPLTWVVLVVIFLVVLENATHTPSNSDTGLYHAQTIHWFEEYHVVPGLGNLHTRLAFNSSWLVLNAAFSLAFLGLQSFHLVGAVLFLSSILYFAGGLDALIRKRLSVAIVLKVLFLPLSFYLFSSEISSPGTDVPVSLITWCILIMWVEIFGSQSRTELKTIVLVLLCFFSLTIKLAAVPLLLPAVFVVSEYFMEKKWRNVFIIGMVTTIILLPWMIRSVILSGYLIFPVPQIDLFHVDWKMARDQVEATRQSVIDFARFQRNRSQALLGMNVIQWAPIWLERQTANRKIIYIFALLSPLLMVINRYRYPVICSRKYLIMYFTCIMGVVFWFLTAPDIRFGYGFLTGICLVSLSPFLMDILKLDKNLKLAPFIVFLALLIFYLNTLVLSLEPSTIDQRWLLPADYLPSKTRTCEISNGWVYCQREGSQCHYLAFPCIPKPRPNVEMRGSTYQDGFRTKP